MPNLDRRQILTGLSAMLGYPAAAKAPRDGDRLTEGLGELAHKKGLLFGAAMSRRDLRFERAIYLAEARIITPGDEMKFHDIWPQPEIIDFEGADTLVGFAERHRMAIRGHTLIWNEYLPQWVYRLSKRDIASLVDRYIDLVAGRYRGRIHSWDVVNEPLSTEPADKDWLARGPFFDALGQDYIARSLRRARAADPSAKLLINETHTERGNWFGHMYQRRLLRLIDELKSADVPLDGIGLQAHLDPSDPFRPDEFLEFLEKIAERGLEIQITELDVVDKSFPDDIAQRDAEMAQWLLTFLRTALKCRAVKVLVTWGFTDHTSWIYHNSLKESPRAIRRPRPCLYDDKLQRKPSWHAVATALQGMPPRL